MRHQEGKEKLNLNTIIFKNRVTFILLFVALLQSLIKFSIGGFVSVLFWIVRTNVFLY